MTPKRRALDPHPVIREELDRFQDDLADLLHTDVPIQEGDIQRLFDARPELHDMRLLLQVEPVPLETSPEIIVIENYSDSRRHHPETVEALVMHDLEEGDKGMRDIYLKRLSEIW